MIRFDVPESVVALNGGLFVSPGFGIHPERVINSYELIFVTQGHLDMFEEDHEFRLSPNQSLVLVPGARHGGLKPYAPDVNFFWAHFRLRRAPSSAADFVVPKVTTVRYPEHLTELFCRFISDQESGILDPVSASELVSLMLCIVGADGGKGASPRNSASAGLAESVRRSIAAGYRNPISTSTIARELGHNADYLERIFRAHEGMSITEAIHQSRISAAKESLLHDARRNINEIGFECGYARAGYFRRMFKRFTGMTPREFRSLYPRTHINAH